MFSYPERWRDWPYDTSAADSFMSTVPIPTSGCLEDEKRVYIPPLLLWRGDYFVGSKTSYSDWI
jgi:hypothetical protein